MSQHARLLLGRAFAVVGALIAWLALALQLAILLHTQAAEGRSVGYALLLYLGFFTILTNGLCALVFTAHLLPRGIAGALRGPWLITSAATCIVIVGGVYFLVLRLLWRPTGVQFWVDVALHYAVPLLFPIFWWLAVEPRSVLWRDLPRILVYPLAYLVYVFVRGALTRLYPYFFIDVAAIGYPVAIRNSLGLLLVFVAVASLFIALNHQRRHRLA